MKKIITAVSIAALIGGGSLAAYAQGTGVNVDAGTGVTVETPVGDANVTAGANADATAQTDNSYDSVIGSIGSNATVDLSAVTDEANISIVLLSSLEGDATAGAAALDEALSANADGNTALHTNVSGNAAISAKLQAEGYSAEDVVAIKSNADGSIVVYVDDRA